MKYDYVTLTDKGNFRKNNQDNLAAIENKFGQLLAIVCDGMGGHAHGEIASKIAVSTFRKYFLTQDFSNLSTKQVNKWMRLVIQKIKEEMEQYSEIHPESLDMGTTLTALIIADKAYVVNIGDSRTFKFVNDKLSTITEDQNIYNDTAEKARNEIIENGEYPEHFNERTYWKILTSALGPTKTMKIDTYYLKNREGLYMLTSDGTHDYIDDETTKEILNNNKNLKWKAKELVSLAKSNMSTDNLSIILAEVYDAKR